MLETALVTRLCDSIGFLIDTRLRKYLPNLTGKILEVFLANKNDCQDLLLEMVPNFQKLSLFSN